MASNRLQRKASREDCRADSPNKTKSQGTCKVTADKVSGTSLSLIVDRFAFTIGGFDVSHDCNSSLQEMRHDIETTSKNEKK
jgi:hypothetical protein